MIEMQRQSEDDLMELGGGVGGEGKMQEIISVLDMN